MTLWGVWHGGKVLCLYIDKTLKGRVKIQILTRPFMVITVLLFYSIFEDIASLSSFILAGSGLEILFLKSMSPSCCNGTR